MIENVIEQRRLFLASRLGLMVIALMTLALWLTSAPSAMASWSYLNSNTPAAVRCITLSSGKLVGGRVSDRIEVWSSANGGTNWTRIGTVAGPASGVSYGDCDFLSDGTAEVYCAFRQHQGSQWWVNVCRSENGGVSWVYDSTVDYTNSGRFIGAPYLWFSRNGDLQCYYDSEQVAANAGEPGFQWINERARGRHNNGGAWTNVGVASRPSNQASLARDGMASVANLNGNDMMLVCEGVDPSYPNVNCLYSILSHNNGATWDYTSRQKIWAPHNAGGILCNAYCPMMIRYGGGPVGVAFCTDDDFATPSSDSAPINQRQAHVKFINSLSTFQQWGNLTTVDASKSDMYAPGLFELSSNHLICTIDFFGGRQVVKYNVGTP